MQIIHIKPWNCGKEDKETTKSSKGKRLRIAVKMHKKTEATAASVVKRKAIGKLKKGSKF